MHRTRLGLFFWCSVLSALLLPQQTSADGKLVRPKSYHGSLEEVSQEAIIIFTPSDKPGEAVEDLILKIGVRGDVNHFAWVIPFPNEPVIGRENAELFRELYDYVESRRPAPDDSKGKKDRKSGKEAPVEVLRRETVGNYDIAIVRENDPGALNDWLKREDYQPLPEAAADVVDFYREKRYVFACLKVTNAPSKMNGHADLHPLRFTFKTGGRDGIYFPMKMTGLQEEPFFVNLYVFYRAWINDDLSRFGFVHRGFDLKYRDWDTDACEPNAGKRYSDPQHDPFLKFRHQTLRHTSELFARLHPGERYYLTNIQAKHLEPEDVRDWDTDLWLFPYYTDPDRVPLDAQEGGPAAGNWPEVASETGSWISGGRGIAVGLGVVIAAITLFLVFRRRTS